VSVARPGGFWSEVLARWALLALVLAFPLLYLPRVLFPRAGAPEGPLGTRAPAAPPPAWIHCVVVTLSEWVEPSAQARLVHLKAWRDRASRGTNVHPNAFAPAGSAASLWTGRFAAHHGVLGEGQALPEGVWTLAGAARESGTATCALLQEPFASATRIGGFARVRERADLSAAEIGAETEAFLDETAGRRRLLWIHLQEPGPEAGELEAVLGGLEASLSRRGALAETLLLLAAFARAGEAPPAGAPFWLALPGGEWRGRRGEGLASLSDATGLLREILRLPPPDPLRRQSPLQSRPELLRDTLRGWEVGGEAWRHGPESVLWIRPEIVLRASGSGPGGRISLEPRTVEEEALRAAGEEAWREVWIGLYRSGSAEIERNAVAPAEARPPTGWRD
jgi:hypothetical protein